MSRRIALFLIVVMALGPFSSMGAQAAGATIDSKYLGSAPGRFNSIKCSDVDDDGSMEILFGNNDGYLSIVQYTSGAYVSEYHKYMDAHRLWGLAIGDVDQDGTKDIVIGGQAGEGGEGFLEVLDGKTRETKWKAVADVPGLVNGSTANLNRDLHGLIIADPDSDGDTELIVSGGYKTDNPWGMVYIFNGETHKLEAMIGPQDSRIRGIAVADIDADGKPELIFGSGVALGERPGEGYIRIFGYDNGTGTYKEEWKSPDMNGDVQGLAVIDVDGDGHLEIVASTGYRYREGYIFIIRHAPAGDGVGRPPVYKQLWQSEDVGPKPYGFDVGDVDGDGIPEIMTGNQPGYLWMFDGSTHEVEWKSKVLGTDVFGITHCDVNKDGQVEIIAGQGGYIGKADWTSGYSTPHIYIFHGKMHSQLAVLGEPDYLEIALQVTLIVLVLALLVALNWYFRRRRSAKAKAKGEPDGYVDKVSRRRGVR